MNQAGKLLAQTCSPQGGGLGGLSLLAAVTLSDGHGRSRAQLGLTLLVLVHRTSMSTASLVPRPFMALLQLPEQHTHRAIQKGQGCLLKVSTQLTLEHLLQVLWEDGGSPDWEPEGRGTGVCFPHGMTPGRLDTCCRCPGHALNRSSTG